MANSVRGKKALNSIDSKRAFIHLWHRSSGHVSKLINSEANAILKDHGGEKRAVPQG